MYIALWRRLARVWTPDLKLEVEAEWRLERDRVEWLKSSPWPNIALVLVPIELDNSSSPKGWPSSESVELSSSKKACRGYICDLTPPIVCLLCDSTFFLFSRLIFCSRICSTAWANCASKECTSVPSRLLIKASSWASFSSRSFSTSSLSMWFLSSANATSASFISSEAPSSSLIFLSGSSCLFADLISEFFISPTISSFSSIALFNKASNSSTFFLFSSDTSFKENSNSSTLRVFSPDDFSSSDSSSWILFPFSLFVALISSICAVNSSSLFFSSSRIFSTSFFRFISNSL